MRYPHCLLLLATILFLTPLAGELWASDSSDIKKTFDAASTTKMGTYQDMREITEAIKRDDVGMNVVEIRWFSPDAVIVKTIWHQGTPKVGTYFYILKNEPTGWHVSERDLYSVL